MVCTAIPHGFCLYLKCLQVRETQVRILALAADQRYLKYSIRTFCRMINNGRARTSTPSCVSLFFLSRTNFSQNATSPLIRNNVLLQHPEQKIPDTTGFQRKLLLFFLKRTVHHLPHHTDSTEIFGWVCKCHLIGRKFLLRIVLW